ncbi:outer membrane protein with beta-barrel domain [Pontibacter ummariensis]|uniref:Outer membrane protein beta-barrel domain-containing protein n=1 Tax=Pontibacter ummariensis TaxID=1610492 RepID=A0A239K8M3_9BACT|nr:DUF6089 family protein [Pontibacter ummariensis]PRY06024.1 outer membrane protein with beta-barrel domain [Pontibacter ummariensis]SNT13959.1 Outer membrane protein beta-barrel domain-containing protein [Pontibacter ummariensis]
MTLHIFKQALLICAMLQIGGAFFSYSAFAQVKVPVTTSELGVGIGGANYKGELSPNYRFLNNQPALTVFYRRDMSNAVTLRGGVMVSRRVGEENNFLDETYAEERPFHAYRLARLSLTLLEVSGGMEYNFLDYYDMSQSPRVSPYVFVGVAGVLHNVRLYVDPDTAPFSEAFNSKITVAVPFGVGVKYALSKHWNLGLEFGARKLFTDQLDRLSEEDEKKWANPYDKDWYYYNGISLSYTFYRTNCPPSYRKRPGLLD